MDGPAVSIKSLFEENAGGGATPLVLISSYLFPHTYVYPYYSTSSF